MKYGLLVLAATLLSVRSTAQSSCSTAIQIVPGIHSTLTQVNGEAPTLLCVGTTPGAFGLWYKFTATSDTTVLLTTNVVGYPNVDTRMHIYVGDCSGLICYASDDDSGPNYTSITSFTVNDGVTYYIAFDSYWNASAFTFQLSELYTPPPPAGQVTFTSTSIPGAGGIMGVVDMNNDGRDDAVSPGYTSFLISHQLPGTGFTTTTYATTPATNTASWSFAIGDFDDNSHRDLLYGGGSGATFMKADATGTAYTQVTFPQYIFCQRTNFVDVNNDGNLDAFSCHDVDANVAFLNDGNGNLTFNQGGYGTTCGNYGSIWTDYDNDGLVDLFVAKCGCDPNDLLMHNNSNGQFLNVAPALGLSDSHQSWSSAWGDYDNDGDMDSFIGASSGGYHKLMANNGDGTFTDVTATSGMSTFAGQSIEWTAHDFNNDGWIDILGGGALHYNNGDMTFSHDASAPGNNAIGDMNNDGFLDIAGSNGYSRNNGNTNNWIKIIPVGVVSNRDGIGARVTITSALGTQIRDVRSGDGFRYMSYIGAYFGIGEDTEIQQIHILWPSGHEDVIDNPQINTTLTMVEGISTGLEEAAAGAFGVYPNPALDELTLVGAALNADVRIIDATGKLALSTRYHGGRLDIASLAPGIYQLQVMSASGTQASRFTKH